MNEFVWLIRLILAHEWDITDDKLKNALNLEVNWIPRNVSVWGLFVIKHNLISHCIHCCTRGLLIFKETNKKVFPCRYLTATDAVKPRGLSDNTVDACPQTSGFLLGITNYRRGVHRTTPTYTFARSKNHEDTSLAISRSWYVASFVCFFVVVFLIKGVTLFSTDALLVFLWVVDMLLYINKTPKIN